MRALVAGGTGAIGRPLVERLVTDGHEVTVLTRSAEGAKSVEASGAEPVVVDAVDSALLIHAVEDARPEVVVNQLTALSRSLRRADVRRGLARTEQLRSSVSPVLAKAALSAGARRLISQSISFCYRPGPGTRDEEDPLYTDGPGEIGGIVRSLSILERATLTTAGLEGVVLRYGAFYGPGTAYAPDGAFAEMVRRRRLPVVGGGRGWFGFLHIDDAVEATVAALNGPEGVYNVVDDTPVTADEWVRHLAELLGARPPRRVPAVIGRLAAGPYATYLFDEQPAVSNRAALSRLAWRPEHPDWRAGFAGVFA